MHQTEHSKYIRINTPTKMNNIPLFIHLNPKHVFTNFTQHYTSPPHSQVIPQIALKKSSKHILSPKNTISRFNSQKEQINNSSFIIKQPQNHTHHILEQSCSIKHHKRIPTNDNLLNSQNHTHILHQPNKNRVIKNKYNANQQQCLIHNCYKSQIQINPEKCSCRSSPFFSNYTPSHTTSTAQNISCLKEVRQVDRTIDENDHSQENDQTLITVEQNSKSEVKTKQKKYDEPPNKFHKNKHQKQKKIIAFNKTMSCNNLQLSFHTNINKNNNDNIVNQQKKHLKFLKVKSSQFQPIKNQNTFDQTHKNDPLQIQIDRLQLQNLRLKQKLSQIRNDYQNIIKNLTQESQSNIKQLIQFKLQAKSKGKDNTRRSHINSSQLIIKQQNDQLFNTINQQKKIKTILFNKLRDRLQQIYQLVRGSVKKEYIIDRLNEIKQEFKDMQNNDQKNNISNLIETSDNEYKNWNEYLQIIKNDKNKQILQLKKKLERKQKDYQNLKLQYEQFRSDHLHLDMILNKLKKKQEKSNEKKQAIKKELQLTKQALEEMNCDLELAKMQKLQEKYLEYSPNTIRQQLDRIIEESPSQSFTSSHLEQQNIQIKANCGQYQQKMKTSQTFLSHFSNIQQCYKQILDMFGVTINANSHYYLVKQINSLRQCLRAVLTRCKSVEAELKRTISENVFIKEERQELKREIDQIRFERTKQIRFQESEYEKIANSIQSKEEYNSIFNFDQFHSQKSNDSAINRISQ